MFRRIDCRKYWRWKRQQESKSKKAKRKVKKRKRKESQTDCIDNVEENEAAEVVLKVSHPEYKKKKKTPWLLVRQPIKRVPLADLVLKSIKPSMEIREYFHNPRHAACLQITSLEVNFISKVVRIADEEKEEHKRKKIEETDSEEESDCKSICSSDSEISLTGMKLTSKDKKEIKKYQSQAQESGNKGED